MLTGNNTQTIGTKVYSNVCVNQKPHKLKSKTFVKDLMMTMSMKKTNVQLAKTKPIMKKGFAVMIIGEIGMSRTINGKIVQALAIMLRLINHAIKLVKHN